MALGDSDQIRRSAELYAAGETLGLSREQTEELVTGMQASNARRTTSSKGVSGFKRGAGVSRTEAEESLLQAAAALRGTDSTAAKLQDFSEEEEAFGRSDGDFRRYIGEQPEYEYDPQDKSVGTRRYKKKDGSYTGAYPMTDRVRPEEGAIANDDALRTVSPSSFRTQIGVLDAAASKIGQESAARKAQIAKMSPIERIMATATGNMPSVGPDFSNLDIYKTRLAQYADPGRDMYGNDRAAAASAVAQTYDMQDPELAQAARYRNEVRAYNEAQDIARDMFTTGGIGAQADLNIRDLGGMPSDMTATMPDAAFNSAGVAVNPNTGEPLAAFGPEHRLFDTSNESSAANALNAPIYGRQSGAGAGEFVYSTVAGMQPAKASQQFGDINAITGRVGEKIANSGIEGDILAANNIRSPQELQAFAEEMVSAGMEMEARTGKKSMFTWSPKLSKKVPISAEQATIADVLTTIGLKPQEQEQLGRALATIAQAPDSARMQSYMDNTGQVYNPSTDVAFGGMQFGAGEIAANPAKADEFRYKAPAGIRGVPGSAAVGSQSDLGKRLRDLNQPTFIGAIAEKPGTLETTAGPGYLNRYKSRLASGLHGQDIANKLFSVAQERARRQGKPVDMEKEKANIVKGMLTDIRASNANAERARQMDAVISTLPPSLRKEDIGNSQIYIPGQPFSSSGRRRRGGSIDGFWGS